MHQRQRSRQTPGLGATSLLLSLLVAGCSSATSDDVALGTLERDRVALTATVSEVLVELPVSRGTMVRKGSILARLDDRLQLALVARADAEVARAAAHLQLLENGPRPQAIAAAKAEVAGAEAAVREAGITYTRNLQLRQSNAVSEADLDRSKAVRDAAEAHLEAERERLDELTAGSRVEEILEARAALAAANAERDYQRALLDDLTIRATRDGLLDNLPWNVGERVTRGSPVAVILAGDRPHARVYVPERHRVQISSGDQLQVHVDVIGEPFAGRVRWISSEPSFTPYYGLAEENRGRLVYVAEVDLPESAADLPSGVPAQALMP